MAGARELTCAQYLDAVFAMLVDEVRQAGQGTWAAIERAIDLMGDPEELKRKDNRAAMEQLAGMMGGIKVPSR